MFYISRFCQFALDSVYTPSVAIKRYETETSNPSEESKSEESDEEKDEIQAMVPSEALQKLKDLLLFAHSQRLK